MSDWRNNRTEVLKFHVREWDYEPKEVKANFQNDVRKYVAWIVRCHPSLKYSS